MLRTTLILSFSAMLLAGCGSKTAAEKEEEERAQIREQKRQQAQKYYSDLSTKFPDHDKAGEARAKVKALDAQAPKK